MTEIQKRIPAVFENSINSLVKEQNEYLNGIEVQIEKAAKEQQAELTQIREQIENKTHGQGEQLSRIERTVDIFKQDLEVKLERLMEGIQLLEDQSLQSNLFSIRNCKRDKEFDDKLIPLNRFFDGHGMAISMHLTSVAEKPAKIIYETADIVRTTTLSLVADEIKRRGLAGETAELGVARGNFARVINAMFIEKKLYLFDTFDGFQPEDISYEKEYNYSNAKQETYAGIQVESVLKRMKNRDQCIVRQGYFPDTVVGLEDETYCFVSIDCDLYKPIYAGLEYFYPRMVKGGCIFVHDYRSKYYRGVKAALMEFAEKYNIHYVVIPDNTGSAIIIK